MSDPRTLVKSYQYIDLPGEPPEGKLWPGVNNIIVLRKHRDVVFDIKLKAGATYTLKTDQPESKYGRFYDTRHKQTVAKATFTDGEPLHIWVGRRFQGNLILMSGDKEIGRYPIKKMDCTGTCTDDPKDKPAPMIVVMQNDDSLAKNLVRISDAGLLPNGVASPRLTDALQRASIGQTRGELLSGPFDPEFSKQRSAAMPPRIASTGDSCEIGYAVHMFCVSSRGGIDLPSEVAAFFQKGDQPYKFKLNPHDVISRNWILGQIGNVGMYIRDAWYGAEPWAKQFWNRSFYLMKRAGQNVLMFSTGPEDYKVLGFLLIGWRKEVQPGTKLMTIAGGAGSLSSAGGAAWSAAKGSFAGNSLIAFFIGAGIDSIVWFNDPTQDFRDLLAVLLVDAGKAMLVSAGISLAEALVVGIAAAGGVTVGVIAVAGVALVITVGLLVDYIFDGSGKRFMKLLLHDPKAAGKQVGDLLQQAGKFLESSLPQDYGNAYSGSTWALVP